VSVADYDLIQAMETAGPNATRWRYRGETPSPERWLQTLWNGVYAQFLIVRMDTGQPVGLVFAYRASRLDGHCYFAVLGFGEARGPHMTFGIALFLNYLFTVGGFRRLYAEVPAFNLEQFGSVLDRYCEVEAQMRDHSFWDGRYWDMYHLTFRREVAGSSPLLNYAAGGTRQVPPPNVPSAWRTRNGSTTKRVVITKKGA
jgi:hypothetical protein